ncbi:hypothetical protein GCM10023174_22700 [Chelativorans composti]
MKRVVSAALLSAFLTGSALAADTVVNHDQAPELRYGETRAFSVSLPCAAMKRGKDLFGHNA